MRPWERAVQADQDRPTNRPTNRPGAGCPYPTPPPRWGSAPTPSGAASSARRWRPCERAGGCSSSWAVPTGRNRPTDRARQTNRPTTCANRLATSGSSFAGSRRPTPRPAASSPGWCNASPPSKRLALAQTRQDHPRQAARSRRGARHPAARTGPQSAPPGGGASGAELRLICLLGSSDAASCISTRRRSRSR